MFQKEFRHRSKTFFDGFCLKSLQGKFTPILFLVFFCSNQFAGASILKPGFSKEEYIEILRISAKQVSIVLDENNSADSASFIRVYRSPEMGLHNQWDLYTNKKGIAVISIRGTTKDFVSWLANFYAAMVPAKGSLQLENDYKFEYHLADHPHAAVHTGWLIGTGMLARDMLPKIDSLYKSGIKDIMISGHSQGGAISYLLTSHFYYLRSNGKLPRDLTIKTYCSGAPKPGNLYYAYEYESLSSGWAFNVVNAADWVPEMPVTVQTTTDVNHVNPFVNALPIINKQKFVQRIILRKAFKKLSGPPRKSQEEYLHYLGEKVYLLVKQNMPEFVKPDYFQSINYVRTGETIVLLPDENYRQKFPDNQHQIFMHHHFEPYYFLVSQLKSPAMVNN